VRRFRWYICRINQILHFHTGTVTPHNTYELFDIMIGCPVSLLNLGCAKIISGLGK